MTVTDLQPALNPVQLHLMQMFRFNSDADSLNELQAVLYDYYKKKVHAATATLADNCGMDNARIDEVLNTHLRTPYT
jgi:hypothetical protein